MSTNTQCNRLQKVRERIRYISFENSLNRFVVNYNINDVLNYSKKKTQKGKTKKYQTTSEK